MKNLYSFFDGSFFMLGSRWIKNAFTPFIFSMVFLTFHDVFFVKCTLHAQATLSPKIKVLLKSSAYGASGGALLGLASMAFGMKPRTVAQGASLGLYAGILFGAYVAFSHEFQFSPRSSFEQEDLYELPGGGGFDDDSSSNRSLFERYQENQFKLRDKSYLSYSSDLTHSKGNNKIPLSLKIPLFSYTFSL